MSKKGILSGALVLSAGTMITKVLGAFYRVPLTKLLGAEGLGIYQMVFPFYCILLTLSSTGIPSALSKLIAEGGNGKKTLYKSIIAFGVLGAVGSLAMFFASDFLAISQGNLGAGLCYKLLSPSVVLVSVLSCFRGYFQGNNKMTLTAVTQVLEQVIKIAFSITLLIFINAQSNVLASVAVLGVTVSEFIALLVAVVWYVKSKKQSDGWVVGYKRILSVVFPITLSCILLPVSHAVDSFLVVNLLPLATSGATALFGIYSGGVQSLIGVPVAVCYGVAISALPKLSKFKTDKSIFQKVLLITLLVGFLGFGATFFLAKPLVKILYGGLSADHSLIMIRLVKLSAIQVLLLSVMQTLASTLYARDHLLEPSVGLFFGIIVKVVLVFLLVPNEKVSIFGVAISDICCYFVATICNLLYIKYNNTRKSGT